MEHDTYPHGEIDFDGIVSALLTTDTVDLIRLNIWHSILAEHRHLYPEQRKVHEIAGVPLIKTIDWSQRPHFARTQWYRDLLAKYVEPGTRIWIEHVMYGEVIKSGWEKFKLMVYAPEGDMTRSGHTDGRHWRVA